MRILAIDPAKCTGWAVMDGPESIAVVDCGVIRPKRTLPMMGQMEVLRDDLAGIMMTYSGPWAGPPFDIPTIVEVPSKGGPKDAPRGMSLATYGIAVGVVIGLMLDNLELVDCHAADVNTWTKCVPKPKRAEQVIAQFPEWEEEIRKNKGLDIADAIGLGWWWLRQQEIKSRFTEVAGKRKD